MSGLGQYPRHPRGQADQYSLQVANTSADTALLFPGQGSQTSTMATVAAEQPIMAQGPEVRLDVANLTAVETGMNALIGAVHHVPLPAQEAEQAQASTVVASGDQAAQAWTALTASSAEATPEQIAQAAEATGGFVAGLTQLGVNCTPIG